ncbi:MAG: hypothetical protein ACOCP8_05305 [archaeon]
MNFNRYEMRLRDLKERFFYNFLSYVFAHFSSRNDYMILLKYINLVEEGNKIALFDKEIKETPASIYNFILFRKRIRKFSKDDIIELLKLSYTYFEKINRLDGWDKELKEQEEMQIDERRFWYNQKYNH